MNLSPGIAHACFELLDLISRRAMSFVELRSSFGYIGVMRLESVLEASQELNWIRADTSGSVSLTPSGSRLMIIGNTEHRLRQTILDYLDIENPFWVQNASFGRNKLLSFAGTAISQVFLEAGLIHGTSEEVVSFWDSLAARARGQKEDQLVRIGREGERLSIAFERERTGTEPKWVSIESNADGYDILSVVSREDPSPLSIEVKATRMGLRGEFHITRNEWERASLAPFHAFHLWDMGSASPQLAVLTPEDVAPHSPVDRGAGEWEMMCTPFAAFESHFDTYAA